MKSKRRILLVFLLPILIYLLGTIVVHYQYLKSPREVKEYFKQRAGLEYRGLWNLYKAENIRTYDKYYELHDEDSDIKINSIKFEMYCSAYHETNLEFCFVPRLVYGNDINNLNSGGWIVYRQPKYILDNNKEYYVFRRNHAFDGILLWLYKPFYYTQWKLNGVSTMTILEVKDIYLKYSVE